MISFCNSTVVFSHVLAVATVSDGPQDDVESPIISIYDLRTLSLKYVFAEPGDVNNSRRRFVNVKFLYDNIFIAALVVGGDDASDCALYYYSWRNSKVDTRLQIDGPVVDVSFRTVAILQRVWG